MRYKGPIERNAAIRGRAAHTAEEKERGLTVLAARAVHLYDVWVVDLLQEGELGQEVTQLGV